MNADAKFGRIGSVQNRPHVPVATCEPDGQRRAGRAKPFQLRVESLGAMVGAPVQRERPPSIDVQRHLRLRRLGL